MAFQGNFTEKFSTRILQKLEMPIKEIAFHLGVSYSTYHNWLVGLCSFPPDLIPKLFQITKDIRIFTFFLYPCNFLPLEDPFCKGMKLIERTLKDMKELWNFLNHNQNE